MTRYFVLDFVDQGITAKARLLEDQAPETCRILWQHLPYEGPCGHAIFSGTIAAHYIDPSIVVPTENATTLVQTGDLMFTHYDAGVRHGYSEALSEIYWAYDRYCRPTAPGQLIPVYPNVFGTFLPGSEDFFEASRRIRYDGVTPVRITGEEGA